jgi:hypothetical protein
MPHATSYIFGLRSAFVSTDFSNNTPMGRLSEIAYSPQDADFVRFRDQPLDDSVKSVVVSVTSADEDERHRFLDGLDGDAVDTLRLYAKRRTLQSRRRSSMNTVDDVMDAFALIPHVEDVPWDTWLKGSLFISRSLGRDLDSIAERYGELSSVEAAQRFDVAFEAMSRVESLSQCFLAEVTTTYGTGFIETLVHRDTKATGAFYSAPRQADEIVPYHPTTNLAQLAANLADAFDETKKVRTDAITQDQLAGMTFSQQVPGAFLETAGCLSFYADAPNDNGSFKVFVAELPDDVNVELLAEGATGDDQAVIFDEGRLIFLLAPPNFDDDADTTFDFVDYVRIAQGVLRASLPVGWHNR